MKKQLLVLFGAMTLSFGAISQEDKRTLIPCATFDAMEEGFKNDPNLRTKYNLIQSQLELEYQAELQKMNNNAAQRTAAVPVYTIPVVFHIMGALNISDQAFVDLIGYINNDYAKTGPDIASISNLYSSLYVDAEIRFALAKRDPNGNCTNGIIRHDDESIYWSQSNPNYKFSGTGTNRWPVNKYLNIYIVECISSSTYSCPTTSGAYIGGYTYLPGSTPYSTNGNMGDAIVMLRNQIPVSSASQTDSRTLSHEIGHWLNLQHTFGSTNNPGVSCGDDGVTDTPPTKGNFSTCPASAGTNTCDASGNQNTENIMDYSSCPRMFTQGQVTRMRTAITSSTGGRNNLWTTANLAATGISTGYTCTPVADFYASKKGVCVGSTTTFFDNSEVGTSGTYSWTFQGGTPATSTATSQAVTYAAAGTYSVGLTVTNPNGTNTATKVGYITVTNGTGGTVLPNTIDFETSGIPAGVNVVNPDAATVAWTQYTGSGANSTSKAMYLNNYTSSNILGDIDYFETPYYDFSNTSNISLSYYYAYAKRSASQIDSFKVQYSLDCGGTWSNVLGIPTIAQMATASGGTVTNAFAPSSAQWVLKTIVPGLLTSLVNKPSVKFRFYFRTDVSKTTSNNIYIDQINLTGNVTTGITQLESSIGLSIFPNPTNSSAVINFNASDVKDARINVVDMIGRVVESSDKLTLENGAVNYTVNANNSLAKGVYIINLDMNGQRISKKLIVE